MTSSRPFQGTTNDEGQTLGFYPKNHGSLLVERHQEYCPHVLTPPLAKAVAASRQTPREKPMPHSLHRNQDPLFHYQALIGATMNFSTSISFMKIYINTCPMARKRR
jgi:hypothetical protein